eukprot:CAMPEP_0168489506 /NCGR_PEP_ID=MMETSP0228-20121227/68700_1 /TAXON_ID=133427 /ORGANISM="Protoceratium reticulatum, Strain CCCM 535 (=CCMP 1889)" /LENGTH=72 /DNA_ID=CAMNT_0008506183 /DNA_START=20 /DNA_END=234 /DNA_ORIENTATION=-
MAAQQQRPRPAGQQGAGGCQIDAVYNWFSNASSSGLGGLFGSGGFNGGLGAIFSGSPGSSPAPRSSGSAAGP